MDDYMKLEFDANSSNESFARVSIAAFVVRLDPTREEISDIKTALSEAVTNAIIHGYENIADGIVWVECRIKDNTVEIKVIDKGRGIENVEKAMEPLYTSHPEMERSGMGFTVMETFMDTVNVDSIVGVGTKVTMTKKICANRL